MAVVEGDRDFWFGLIALRGGFVDHAVLMRTVEATSRADLPSLGSFLRESGCLTAEVCRRIEAEVDQQLNRFGPATMADPYATALPARWEPASGTSRASRDPGDSSTLPLDSDDPYATRAFVPPPRAEGPDQAPNAEPTFDAFLGQSRRFHRLRLLAKGGLGAVFIAHDSELNREVALKEIQERHSDDLNSRARFLLEAEITGSLEHPGIVPIYGLGQYPNGSPYYAMRLIHGDTLTGAIGEFHRADGPARDPGERAIALRKLLVRFIEACDAVAYAHSKGVIHRDIKPNNIMIGPFGETLVVDWGLAKVLGRSGPKVVEADDSVIETGEPAIAGSASSLVETVRGTSIGTPHFMSPEQAAGDVDHLGPASDIYSLGATLYVLITGRLPFEGLDLGEVLTRTQLGEFPPPRQVNRLVPAPWTRSASRP